MADPALDVDTTTHVDHEVVADREAQARSHTHRLGGVERVEDPCEVLLGNSDARVLDGDRDRGALISSSHADAHLVARRAPLLNRLRGVHQEVQQNLPQSRFVGDHGRHRANVEDQLGPVTNLVLRDAERGAQDLAYVHQLVALFVVSREGPEIADDATDSFRPFTSFLECVAEVSGERPVMPQHEVEVRHDVGERIVDLVRDPGGKQSHARQPLASRELTLQREIRRDVPGDDERRDDVAVAEHRRDPGLVPALCASVPHGSKLEARRLAELEHALDALAIGGNVRGRSELVHRMTDDVFDREARRVTVDTLDDTVAIDDEYGIGDVLRQRAPALLARP